MNNVIKWNRSIEGGDSSMAWLFLKIWIQALVAMFKRIPLFQ